MENKEITKKELNDLLQEQKDSTIKIGTVSYNNEVIKKIMFHASCKIDDENRLIIYYDVEGNSYLFVLGLVNIDRIIMEVIFGVIYYNITYNENYHLELKVDNRAFRTKYLEKAIESKSLANILSMASNKH